MEQNLSLPVVDWVQSTNYLSNLPLSLPGSFFLSLSLSLSHTHTHTHTLVPGNGGGLILGCLRTKVPHRVTHDVRSYQLFHHIQQTGV